MYSVGKSSMGFVRLNGNLGMDGLSTSFRQPLLLYYGGKMLVTVAITVKSLKVLTCFHWVYCLAGSMFMIAIENEKRFPLLTSWLVICQRNH